MDEYGPPFAPHVRGTFTNIIRDEETGEPEPVKVELRCARCGTHEARPCDLGRPRSVVHAFAVAHLTCAGKDGA